MNRRQFPGTPEEMLPIEVPESVERVQGYDPSLQLPFVAVPNLLKQQPNPYVDVRGEDVTDITTISLTRCIHSREGDYTVDGVALNAAEFGKIALSPERVAERAEARAANKYRNANPILKREHELERRSDVLRQYADKHSRVIEGYDAEINDLGALMGYAKWPNLRRASDVRTRQMAATAWTSITSMLTLVGDRKNWDRTKRERVNEAMLRALTTGPDTVKLAEWKRVLPIVYDYARRKRQIFVDRNEQIAVMGAAATAELTELLESNGFTVR